MGHGKRNMGTFFYICAPEWIHGRAGGPAGPSGPTRQGLFYDSGWRNGSQPSLLLDHTAHPGHLPPSPAVPSPLLPERGYRTERLERKTINQSKSPKTSTKTPWAGCTLSMKPFLLPMVWIFCVTRSVSAPTLAAAAAASVPAWPPPTTMTSYCCRARWLAPLETCTRKLRRGGSLFESMWDAHLEREGYKVEWL